MKKVLPNKQKNYRDIYLDHAAKTPIDTKVLEAMNPFLHDSFGNPASIHHKGIVTSNAVFLSRAKIAKILHTQPETIYFTGNGTESCNLSILGIARAHKDHGRHIITTAIEHDAVLGPCAQLEKEGFEITYLPVNKHGEVSLDDLKNALRSDTILVSIMYANNEIGTIFPLQEIGKLILKWRKKQNTVYPYFHTDACQATTTLPLMVESLHVDAMSFNATKMYGPAGIGVMYLRKDISIQPLIFGGGQEHGLRAGTTPVALAVGCATALELVQEKREKYTKKVRKLSEYFFEKMQDALPEISCIGLPVHDENRLAHNVNIHFPGIEADTLLLYLDAYGISCSSASACSTIHDSASHVLQACGLDDTQARECIRFTLGKDTTKKDVKHVIKVLPEIIASLKK